MLFQFVIFNFLINKVTLKIEPFSVSVLVLGSFKRQLLQNEIIESVLEKSLVERSDATFQYSRKNKTNVLTSRGAS